MVSRPRTKDSWSRYATCERLALALALTVAAWEGQLKKLENPRNKTRVACRKAYEVATGGATALELNAGRGECVCTGVCW